MDLLMWVQTPQRAWCRMLQEALMACMTRIVFFMRQILYRVWSRFQDEVCTTIFAKSSPKCCSVLFVLISCHVKPSGKKVFSLQTTSWLVGFDIQWQIIFSPDSIDFWRALCPLSETHHQSTEMHENVGSWIEEG